MSATKASVAPRFKLWISSSEAEGVFGDGKWRLLKAIESGGSLRAASESLGISYRKAWGDLRKAEERLGVIFLEKHRGGAGGGETTLTDAGREWIAGYSRFRTEIEKTTAKAFGKHIQKLLKRKGRKKR